MDKLHGFKEQAAYGLELLGQAGMAVSVVQDGDVLFAGGFGFRDVEQGLKADEKTIFPIGSATKSFTAAAVMLLHERGLLDIDKPIRHYLPELLFKDDTASLLATPRDLLCHRTGLARHDMLWVLRPYISRRELPSAIREIDASKPFRTTYQYSNIMYACLGRLVEKLDGRVWEDFIRQEFFGPLGMPSACFTPDEAIVNGNFSLAYERPRGTGRLDPVAYSRLGGMAPAGAIGANVLEMANWLRFNLGKGLSGSRQLLSADHINQMFIPNMPILQGLVDAPEITPLGYGLGWEIESFRGKTLINHGGNVSGSSAMVAFMPEINAGVTIAVNTGTSMLTYAAMYDVFDRLLGYGGQKDWAQELKTTLDKLYAMMDEAYGAREKESLPAKTIRTPSELAGDYRHPAYGTVKVLANGDGSLSLKTTEYTMPLKNVHYDIFSAQLILDYQSVPLLLAFQTGIDGTVKSLDITLELTVKPIEFIKQ
jgi:CubicO group peptidase (beta-lactamase class C family)